jgi:hypothetical protein
MKTPAIIGMLLFATLPTAPAEEDPFGESVGEAARPERSIAKLPSAVTHQMIDANRHQYTISDIYMGAASKEEDPKEASSTYKALIPDVLDIELDFKTKKATFSTSRELSWSELAYAVDDVAELGGDFPYWAELDARDLEDTKEFARVRYEIEEVKKDPPAELAWFWIPDDQKFQIPLSLGGFGQGSLLIVPATAQCMCHSRFTLRILDPNGRVIWKQTDAAYGGIRIALSSDDELGMHKIWMRRSDHGTNAGFIIKGQANQE